MTRRFVIGAEPLTTDQDAELRKFLHTYGAWWHWIANLWLLAVPSNDTDVEAEQIRDKILELNPRARVIVFEFPEDLDWAVSGSTNSSGKRINEWLEGTWAKK